MKFTDWFEKSKIKVEDLLLSDDNSEIQNTNSIIITEPEKFIDSLTGKEYKTAAALKSAITRRINRERK